MTYEISLMAVTEGKDDKLLAILKDVERKEQIRFISPPVRLENITKRNMAIAKMFQTVSTLILKQERKPLK